MESLQRYLRPFPSKYDFIDDWYLASNHVHVILIWLSYLFFVLVAGPAFMKNRQPFRLRKLIILYNLAQVAFSMFQFSKALELVRPAGYIHITCDEDYEGKKKIAWFFYVFFCGKLSELIETILFILRKKYNQVSFLHVYHHSISIWAVWYTLKMEPVQAAVFLGFANTFVHIIMYGYYFLSAFPSLTKYLWWKKYITLIQVLQFVFVISHALINYKYSDCRPSIIILLTIVINEGLLILLFLRFYVQSYLKPKTADKAKSVKAN